MRLHRFALGVTVALLCMPNSAQAIIIETGGVRIGGYLIRDDGAKLTIRVLAPDGKEKDTVYDRSTIKIIYHYDRKRLEKLSRDNPQAYSDYAEELARQTEDPEARHLARRLFLIAAHLDPRQFGRSSLLRLSDLARTPLEARKCRALAFLLDPRGAAKILKVDAAKPAAPTKDQAKALQDFQKALRYFRSGEFNFAKDYAKREGVAKIFGMAPGMMDQKTFLRRCVPASCEVCKAKGKVQCSACNGTGVTVGMVGRRETCPTCKGQRMVACTTCAGTGINQVLSDDVLRIVLRAELWAIDRLAGDNTDRKEPAVAPSWSALMRARNVGPVSPLSLETISEFDPRLCLYRDGAWVAP